MKTLQRMALLPAVGCCGVGLGFLGGAWIEAITLMLFSIGSVITPRRELDKYGQLIAALVWGALVYVWFMMVLPEVFGERRMALHLFGQMGVSFFVGLVVMRQFLTTPLLSHMGSALLLLFALLFLGIGNGGTVYLSVIILGTAFALVGARVATANTRGPYRPERMVRQALPVTMVVVIATAVAAFFIMSIPKAYEWSINRFMESISIRSTGFSRVLSLDALDSMFVSSKIVFRAHTSEQAPQYLRGAIYDQYRNGRWSNSQHNVRKSVNSVEGMNGSGTAVRVSFVDDSEYLFTPLGTGRVSTSVPLRVNQFAVMSVPAGKLVEEYSYRIASTPFSVLPPTKTDMELPKALAPQLHSLAAQWIRDASENGEKVRRIAAALQTKYQYSLSFSRSEKRDALQDFLFDNKQGHCEYFASAFALLARAVGVPTRVVGGYQMREYNQVGEYFIVREQHAHTWSEAWVNGQWVTVEATPPGVTTAPSGEVGYWVDALGVKLGALFSAVSRLSQWVWVASVMVLVAIWGLIRLLRGRFSAPVLIQHLGYSLPHELFDTLESVAGQRVPRKSSESIEHWARRVETAAPDLCEIGRLLGDYAAWRYGGSGNIDALILRYRAWVSENRHYR